MYMYSSVLYSKYIENIQFEFKKQDNYFFRNIKYSDIACMQDSIIMSSAPVRQVAAIAAGLDSITQEGGIAQRRPQTHTHAHTRTGTRTRAQTQCLFEQSFFMQFAIASTIPSIHGVSIKCTPSRMDECVGGTPHV